MTQKLSTDAAFMNAGSLVTPAELTPNDANIVVLGTALWLNYKDGLGDQHVSKLTQKVQDGNIEIGSVGLPVAQPKYAFWNSFGGVLRYNNNLASPVFGPNGITFNKYIPAQYDPTIPAVLTILWTCSSSTGTVTWQAQGSRVRNETTVSTAPNVLGFTTTTVDPIPGRTITTNIPLNLSGLGIAEFDAISFFSLITATTVPLNNNIIVFQVNLSIATV